jgi:hypothetical protein
MKLKIIVFAVLFILGGIFATPIWAQPSNPPGGDGGGDPVGDETDIPFGIEWLLIGGVLYGATKFKKNRK